MKISVITLFAEMFTAITEYGVSARSIKNGLVDLEFYNPRDFTDDVHHKVDDRPYGGGPGMVMMVQPLRGALQAAESGTRAHRVCLTPQGQKLDQTGLEGLLDHKHLILVSGRYEGIDERFLKQDIDEEWSIGDYVLSGGELAAMVMIDSMIRLMPGSLGHEKSASEDSFFNGLLDYPHYTRPLESPGNEGEAVQDVNVPNVLLSGNHREIERWRLKQSLGRTWQRRPDLLKERQLNEQEQNLLDEFIREQNTP